MPGILEERLSSKRSGGERRGGNNIDDLRKRMGEPVADKTERSASSGSFADRRAEHYSSADDADFRFDPGYDEALTEEDVRELENIEAMMQDETYEKQTRRSKIISKVLFGLISAGCIYLVLLIYGTAITEYQYGASGSSEPIVLSVSEIAAKDEFNTILGLYLQARDIYEQILTLDYRLGTNLEEPMLIAPEYEKLLDSFSTINTQIEATVISSAYNQILTILHNWTMTHAPVYCQNISVAISQNDETAANEALAGRSVMEQTFQQITQNLILVGDSIKGIDLIDLKEWNPDQVALAFQGLG